jgi:signal transduction histidine kinase/ligand-binding sensor domain-containing protein
MKIWNSITAALVLFFITQSAYALDPNEPFSSYIQTRFTIDDGLSSNIINDIVQSPDGFLWITYGNGTLGRFDGQHATQLPVATTVNTPAIAPNGDLWVSGLDLLQIPASALNQYGPLQAIVHHPNFGAGRSISCLHFSRSGILWVGTAQGLYRFEHGVFSPVLSKPLIDQIEESANGDLLLTTSEGLVVWDGSQAVSHPELATQLGIKLRDIFHVFEDSRGVTWICTAQGVARRTGGTIEKLQPWGPTHGAFRVYEDSQHNIWIAGAEGLSRVTATGLELVVKGMKVRTVYADRDGDLWVGTNGDGLFRFKDRAVRMFTKTDGLPASNLPMTVLTAHDGALWIGYNCGGIVRFDGHSFRTYDEKDGLLNSCVYALAEDLNHDLWIGTFGGGVFQLHDGRFTQYAKAQGLVSDNVLAAIAARDGSVWLATPGGLSHLRNGQVRNYTRADGLSSRFTYILYEDRRGGIWVGTEFGIDRLEGDRFVKAFSTLNDLAWPIGEDSNGAMYVGLRDGNLFRVDNDQLTEIIPGEGGFKLIETNQGDLWLNGLGIIRAPIAGLQQKRGHDEPADFEVFGVADGMSSTQVSSGQPGLALTPDGKLWVPTLQGLAMMDLQRLPRTDRKPVIHMKEFTIGRNQQLPGQELVLPAGTSHIELRFDAIEITSPDKIRLQYRLDGVDTEWLDVKPPGHAIYSTISAGTHAFHVRACNRNGIWDRTGMVYLIIQKPFFYQTTWFRLAMIATVLLMVVGLYRLRLHQATARLNALFDERLAERTRIARELHDTLLQTIQGSKLVADDALERATDFAHLHGRVEQLSAWLGQATQEGREALNSLRTSTVETNNLAGGLRMAIEECSLNKSMTVKFLVTGALRDLHPIARDEIYRIGYEAIRNACEHSSASELEVSLSYAQDLTLRVKDNGVGIAPAIIAEGKAEHFGLQGMRERADRIDSKFTLVSSPDSGTEIILTVPGVIIFRSTRTTRFKIIKGMLLGKRDDSDGSSSGVA